MVNVLAWVQGKQCCLLKPLACWFAKGQRCAAGSLTGASFSLALPGSGAAVRGFSASISLTLNWNEGGPVVCSVVTGAASCFSDVFCSMHAADSMHKRLESSCADAAKTTMPVLSIQI